MIDLSERTLWGDPSGKIRTFALIPIDNPMGLFTEEEWDSFTLEEKTSLNTDRTELQQKLSKARAKKYDGDKAMGYGGFDYMKTTGYGNHGISYMVFNLILDDAKAVARAYGQESFFFGTVSKNPNIEPSQIAYYKTVNPRKTYRLVESLDTIADESEVEDFLSKFGVKFRINMKEFEDNISPIKNPVAFERSFVGITFLQRGSLRRDSRRDTEET